MRRLVALVCTTTLLAGCASTSYAPKWAGDVNAHSESTVLPLAATPKLLLSLEAPAEVRDRRPRSPPGSSNAGNQAGDDALKLCLFTAMVLCPLTLIQYPIMAAYYRGEEARKGVGPAPELRKLSDVERAKLSSAFQK